ncbi:MAG: hypothetical protein J7J51_03870 [Candidatus Omnitrophica bacterium]|nr:hypothetical protein [Candidatus Omnitrophota bacterium]
MFFLYPVKSACGGIPTYSGLFNRVNLTREASPEPFWCRARAEARQFPFKDNREVIPNYTCSFSGDGLRITIGDYPFLLVNP